MRPFVTFSALTLIAIGIFLVTRSKHSATTTESPDSELVEVVIPDEEAEELPAVAFLASHGQPDHSPLQDVKLIHDFVGIAALENRHLDAFYLSTNAGLTEIILGKKGRSHPISPLNHHTLGKNQYGELTLLDRWKTPYRLHLVDRNRIEIFSAGPDKISGNEDDLSWPPKEQLYQAKHTHIDSR